MAGGTERRTAVGERAVCAALGKAGACRAFALPESAYCISHEPTRQESLRVSRAKGATTTNKLRSIEGRRRKLTTAPELVAFTSTVVQDVLSGTVPPDVARVVLYGVSIQKSLLETSELEKRLAALEAAQPAKKGHLQWGR